METLYDRLFHAHYRSDTETTSFDEKINKLSPDELLFMISNELDAMFYAQREAIRRELK